MSMSSAIRTDRARGRWIERIARLQAMRNDGMTFDEWWHQQMPNLVSGEEADDRAIAEAAWAACARELFRDAVTVEVKAVFPIDYRSARVRLLINRRH